jgi:SAM-dependent methyltransferase
MNAMMDDERIKEAVRQAYGAAATCCSGAEPTQAACCSGVEPTQAACCSVAEPVQASCGCRTCQPQPSDAVLVEATAAELDDMAGREPNLADLQPGEVVLDLGSGAGLACLLAARKVGPAGRVIGLDMTPEMIKLARRNAKRAGATNVEFNYGEIEDIPLPDESVDLIISNCVVNLSPDKKAVFREAHRVLKPGGRMVISDIVLHGELPPPIRESLAAWAGCVAGALQEPDYLGKIRAAGFADVQVLSREEVKISQVPDWQLARTALAQAGLPPDALDHTVINARVRAHKPA